MKDEDWFPPPTSTGVGGIDRNSSVVSFVDADEYYADLRAEVEATGSSGQICWIGFDVNVDVWMPKVPDNDPKKPLGDRPKHPGDKSWFDLLKEASDSRDVPIRALLNLHPAPVPAKGYLDMSFRAVEKVNSLKKGAAVNDFRFLFLNGTHHQKLVLVYNDGGLNAYVGTCDLQSKRIDERWCEVHLKVTGEAALELYKVFHRRWSEYFDVFQEMGVTNTYLLAPWQIKARAKKSGNFITQMSTTYGNPERGNPFFWIARMLDTPRSQVLNKPHRLTWGVLPAGYRLANDFFNETESSAKKLIEAAGKMPATYSFGADKGHTGIYQVLKTAIEKVERFIYMEDQYLVDDLDMDKLKSMMSLLEKKVAEPSFKKLIILCTRIDDINDAMQFCAWEHRKAFVDALLAAGKDKVVVCHYRRCDALNVKGRPSSGIFYIHSKTWVFDDRYLVTGSANCNRRGYSHDSELNFGVVDTTGGSIKDLRVRIWKKRLNTEGCGKPPLTDADLSDFLSAAKYWEDPKTFQLTIETNRSAPIAPTAYPDLDFAAYKAKVTQQPGIGPEVSSALGSIKKEGLWNYVVDPGGT